MPEIRIKDGRQKQLPGPAHETHWLLFPKLWDFRHTNNQNNRENFTNRKI